MFREEVNEETSSRFMDHRGGRGLSRQLGPGEEVVWKNGESLGWKRRIRRRRWFLSSLGNCYLSTPLAVTLASEASSVGYSFNTRE